MLVFVPSNRMAVVNVACLANFAPWWGMWISRSQTRIPSNFWSRSEKLLKKLREGRLIGDIGMGLKI